MTLEALGVRVKGNEVFNLNFPLRKKLRYLGPLAGASAGVMDVEPASGGAVLSSIVIGNVPVSARYSLRSQTGNCIRMRCSRVR
jgi:hypothetical protein